MSYRVGIINVTGFAGMEAARLLWKHPEARIVAATGRSLAGKRLAEAIQRNLVEAIASVDRGARTHWVNLAVLAGTVMPAALTEVGFLTNPEEEAKLADPEYQRAAARGIANGILEYLGWSTTVYTS